MKKLQLPAVKSHTGFDQQNMVHCTVTFDSELSHVEQATLTKAATRFYDGSAGGERRPCIFFEFPKGDQLSFRSHSSRELPTRLLFNGLCEYLTEHLGLAEIATEATSPVAPTSPSLPALAPRTVASSQGFVPRSRRFR